MRTMLFSLLCLAFLSLKSQSVDFTRLKLAVSFDTLTSTVHGQVNLDLTTSGDVDSVYLNAVDMQFHEVRLNDQVVEYSFNDKGIWILSDQPVGDSAKLMIRYSCSPRKGIYFIGWQDETRHSPRQIWTQGQGIDHRHWIPHRDDQQDKLVVELDIDFADSYQVMANGKLTEKRSRNGVTTWQYRMEKPMSSYLIALTIGKYDTTRTRSDNGVELTQYFYPQRRDDYDWYYRDNEEIFNFLQSEIDIPYPWQNYKQAPVQDFRHGAMENTTATIFGDFYLVDEIAFNDQNYTYVNAHELAHQWFGNLVTATGSDEHWLHEGFATYYQWLSEKNLYGKDYFDWERYKAARLVWEATAQDSVPLGNGQAGSARFYQKGAWVLHMLQNQLGDSLYRHSIKHYLNRYAYGLVTTDSLNLSIIEVAERDFHQFFDRWVNRPGEPVIQISSGRSAGKLVVSITGVYRRAPDLPLSLPLRLQYEGYSKSMELAIPAGDTVYELTLDDNVLQYWIVNPDMQVLAQVLESRDAEEWYAAYQGTPNLLDKYQVLQSMQEIGAREKNAFLREIVADNDAHFALRAEALAQLIAADDAQADKLLHKALADKNVHFQKEAIRMVSREKREAYMADARRLLTGESYQLRADAVHISVDIKKPAANKWLYDEEFERRPGIPGNMVLVPVLFYRNYLFDDEHALRELVNMSGPAYDFLTRINAISALSNTSHLSDAYLRNLFSSLFDYNWKLSGVARNELQRLYTDRQYRIVIDDFRKHEEANWLDFQKRRAERTFDSN